MLCRITHVVSKVIGYITQQKQSVIQLLVFEHVDVEAGVQVPKGTVEPGEVLLDAILRELREETGLAISDRVQYIGSLIRFDQAWNFFAVKGDANLPDTWVQCVGGDGEDKGMKFRYYWVPLTPEPNLAGKQGDGLELLKNYLSQQTIGEK